MHFNDLQSRFIFSSALTHTDRFAIFIIEIVLNIFRALMQRQIGIKNERITMLNALHKETFKQKRLILIVYCDNRNKPLIFIRKLCADFWVLCYLAPKRADTNECSRITMKIVEYLPVGK